MNIIRSLFRIGFLFKRYAYAISMLLLFVLGIVILQKYNVLSLSVNWAKAESVQAVISASTLRTVWHWVKLNLLVVISFACGFVFRSIFR